MSKVYCNADIRSAYLANGIKSVKIGEMYGLRTFQNEKPKPVDVIECDDDIDLNMCL